MSINRKRKGATSTTLTSEQQRRKTMKQIMADARNAEPGLDRPFDPTARKLPCFPPGAPRLTAPTCAEYSHPAPTMPAHHSSAQPFQSTAPLVYGLPLPSVPAPNPAVPQLHVSNVAASNLPAPTRRPPSRRTPNLQASRTPNLVRDIRKVSAFNGKTLKKTAFISETTHSDVLMYRDDSSCSSV